jgi:succinoglycan biosynthesis transport protein ExoP
MNENNAVALHQSWYFLVRCKWWILGSIVFSLAAAVLLCLILPKRYTSRTLLLVEQRQIPRDYVTGIVEGRVEQRIFSIQQQIKSRTFLGEIVKEFNLYPDEIKRIGLEAAIDRARTAIEINIVGSPEPELRRSIMRDLGHDIFLGVDAVQVSFSDEDPRMAMRVASAIASKFVEENQRSREELVKSTAQFLDFELAKVKAELEAKEEEIRGFKSQHMGHLPQQTDANLRGLDRLQADLTNVNESIKRLTDRLTLMDQDIAEYQATGVVPTSLVASYGKPHPLLGRLKELEEKLTLLSAEYTDSYPDISLTKVEIKKIKSQIAEIYGPELLKEGDKPYDPYLRKIMKRRDELKSEIEPLKKRRESLTREMGDYERRVETAPAIEHQLVVLLRDYENLKENHRTLLDKRLNARVAENLEERQTGKQIRVLDPANLPRKASSPDTRKIIILGLVLGCFGGVGLAYFLEGLNPTFRRREEVEELFGPHQAVTMIPDFRVAYGRSDRGTFLPLRERPSGNPLRPEEGESKAVARKSRGVIGSNGKHSTPEMNVIAKWLPASIVAEQYRVAATQLSLLRAEHKSTIVAVTSSLKGEGKTTSVVNLAYTLARDLGKRTLMVECDFKSPMLHRYTQISSEPGLADLLNSEVPLDTCLYRFGDAPCWVIPVGGSRNGANELIKSQRLVMILSGLRERFDYILMNTPPILPCADMTVLAGLADLLMLVVRAGSTPQQVVKRALSTLRVAKPAFMILNAVAPSAIPSYMHYDYRYS